MQPIEMISFPEINCTPAKQLNQKARVKHYTIYRIRLDLSLYPFHHCTKTAPYCAHFGAVRLRFGVFSVVIACSPGRCRSRRGQLLQEFLLSSVIKRRHILTLQSSQEDIINARVWNRELLTIACFRQPCFVCCQWKYGRPLVVRSHLSLDDCAHGEASSQVLTHWTPVVLHHVQRQCDTPPRRSYKNDISYTCYCLKGGSEEKSEQRKDAVVWSLLVSRRGGCDERTLHAPHSSHSVACSTVVATLVVPWIPLKQVPQVPWTCTSGLHGYHGCHGGLLYDT